MMRAKGGERGATKEEDAIVAAPIIRAYRGCCSWNFDSSRTFLAFGGLFGGHFDCCCREHTSMSWWCFNGLDKLNE